MTFLERIIWEMQDELLKNARENPDKIQDHWYRVRDRALRQIKSCPLKPRFGALVVASYAGQRVRGVLISRDKDKHNPTCVVAIQPQSEQLNYEFTYNFITVYADCLEYITDEESTSVS